MQKPFKYNGISFNTEWASKLSEADFVKEFTHGRPADNLNEKQQANFAKFKAPHDLKPEELREAYKLIKEYVNDKKPAEAIAELPSPGSGSKVIGSNKGSNS